MTGRALALALLAGVALAAPPRFLEETEVAGLDHRYDGGWEYFVGGGVATFDCSGDGFPELFLAGGARPAALYLNRSRPGGPLLFERLPEPQPEGVTGAYPLDVDGDGTTDLALLRTSENLLLRGLGACRFERANERWGFAGGDDWSTAFAALWERDQSWPTVAVGNYIDRRRPGAPFGTCHDNQLFRPARDGTGFAAPLPLSPSYCTLSLLFSDWNLSGTPDLWVSNDRQYYLTNRDRSGSEQLWRIRPDEAPVLYDQDDGWERLQIWGMGIASADLGGDGLPEYFLTSMTDNKLRILAAGPDRPHYRDIAFERGATAHRALSGPDAGRPSTGWHAQFGDVDNDGLLDLFIAKGNVDTMPDFALQDPNNLLLGLPDGSFREAAAEAGLLSYRRGRGAAVVDLDLDGLLDVVVVNRGDGAQLWRNLGPGGNWLQLRLRQPPPNRDAVGAWIEVETVTGRRLRYEHTLGGGHAGDSLGWIHFGLGEAAEARVRVLWPDGEAGPWQTVAANRFAILERGREEPVPWNP